MVTIVCLLGIEGWYRNFFILGSGISIRQFVRKFSLFKRFGWRTPLWGVCFGLEHSIIICTVYWNQVITSNLESSTLTIKPLFLLHATYCDLQKREKDGEQHLKEEEQRRREKLRQHEAKVKMPYSAKRLNGSILESTIKFILLTL